MSIQHIIEEVEKELSTAELAVMIGDTLAGNKQFPQIDPADVRAMLVNGDTGDISFSYGDKGIPIHIHIT